MVNISSVITNSLLETAIQQSFWNNFELNFKFSLILKFLIEIILGDCRRNSSDSGKKTCGKTNLRLIYFNLAKVRASSLIKKNLF